MRILILSDMHGQYDNVKVETMPECDVVLVAGDLTNYGFRAPAHWQVQSITELASARAWFKGISQHCAQVFWVQGNHDLGMPDDFLDPFATNIRDRSATFDCDGIRYSLRGASLTCAFDQPKLAKRWAFTTADPNEDLKTFDFEHHNIVLSHSPPRDCLDLTKAGVRIGSPALRDHILEHRPLLVVCGHVHEAAGIENLGKTMVVNTACRGQVLTLEMIEKPSTSNTSE
jgi:uncharacterized protein